MESNKIGKFIATQRKEKGFTQQELGDKLFVTDKAVSKWERGLSFPDITLLEKLSEVLDVEVAEILNGSRGRNDKLNVQEEIDKTIAGILEEQKLKKERFKKKIVAIALAVFICIMMVSLIFVERYKYYHPSVIKEGDNNYEIGFLGISKLESDGFDELIEIMNKTENVNTLNSNIVWFDFDLYKNGNIKSFNVTIKYFDENHEYMGYGFYEYKNRNLKYEFRGKGECSGADCGIDEMLVFEYSKSLNAKYLNELVKKIPFKRQIKLSNLKFYKVSIDPNMKFSSTTSVFDMRDNKDIEPLNLNDYKKGLGGTIEPGIYLVINLGSGVSSIDDEIYRYVFDNVDGDTKKTDSTMETDYYIDSKNRLLFTRDYGNSWIETDISQDEVKETLNFYRSISIPNSSWFISKNELVPIAYFYGAEPKLKISTDNGLSWDELTFEIENILNKEITHRIVGFKDQNFGYVALGTDWTMGTGEFKNAFLTKNGGKKWTEIELPKNGSSETLMDFIMYDEKEGIVLLKNNQNNEFPYMYVTRDGGKNWVKSQYNVKISKEVDYISNIDSIEKNGNVYTAVLSQGDSRTTKIKIKSNDLMNWELDSTFTSNIHTVG